MSDIDDIQRRVGTVDSDTVWKPAHLGNGVSDEQKAEILERYRARGAKDERARIRRELLGLLEAGTEGIWGLTAEDVDRICPEKEG